MLVLLSLLGSGLMAGLFYAFSVAVLPALASEPGPAGMAAMQRINVVIVRPVFLLVFLGTVVVGLAAVVVALVDGEWPSRPLVVAGTAAYAIASIGLTSGYHVPRNDRLAAADDRTRAIVEVMQDDERGHADTAAQLGATELPLPAKAMMRLSAKVMTSVTYRV